jgi:hypothetical protein
VIAVITIIVLSITIGIISIIRMNRSIKRINELEDILNRYYEERKQTLKLRLKDNKLIND